MNLKKISIIRGNGSLVRVVLSDEDPFEEGTSYDQFNLRPVSLHQGSLINKAPQTQPRPTLRRPTWGKLSHVG